MVLPRNFFFLPKISMRDTAAPVKKAIYSATIVRGYPSSSPRKNAKTTSPNPIPRPLVRTKQRKKKSDAPNAESRLPKKKEGVVKPIHIPATKIAGITTTNGIIPDFKSIKKTRRRHERIKSV